MTIQLAKDQAAQEFGRLNYSDLLADYYMEMATEEEFVLTINRAMEIYAEAKEKEFAEWLHENRWFSFTNGKWNYSFEQGTAISDATYEKNYRKTTQELYEKFKTKS